MTTAGSFDLLLRRHGVQPAKSADRNSLKPSQLQGIAIGMKSRSFDCRRLGG